MPRNERLRQQRIARNWRQQEVADQLGISLVTVQRWERGYQQPSLYYRVKLSALFGVSVQELGLLEEPEESEATDAEPPVAAPPDEKSQEGLSSSPKPESPWNVPFARNPFFTGRSQLLDRLHEQLSQNKSAALTQSAALSGLGGIGKTQAAIEYAYRYRHEYRAIFWVRAESRDTLIADYIAIAQLLNLPGHDAQEQMEVVASIKRWLQQHEGWLLILDNADELSLLPDLLPHQGKGHLLLTTRAQATGKLARSLAVEKMEMSEGIRLVLRRATLLEEDEPLETVSAATRSAAQQLVEELDGLPLALDQAGAYIEETGCSLSEYLALYGRHRPTLLKRKSSMAGDYPHTVVSTWTLSFSQVEQADPAAADVLRMCAFLHSDAIPEEILTQEAAALGLHLQEVAVDPLRLNEAIQLLRRYSLVKRDAEAKLLNLHRLVQVVLQESLDAPTQRQWAQRTVLAVNAAFPRVEYSVWAQCERLLAQALTAAQLIEQYQIVIEEAGRLLHETAIYLQEHARYQEAEQLYQRALHIREQQSEPEHLNVAASLDGLANLYRDQSKYAGAEPLYQRALHIREQQSGTEHLDVTISLDGLAILYKEQGKFAQAESLHQRALAIREQHLGPDHPQVATSLNGLALMYKEQGKYAQAELLYQRALAIREQHLGPDHPQVASSLNNLAILYMVQGKYTQAELLHQRALAITIQAYGEEHPGIAADLNNLAILYYEQGKYTEVVPLFQRALRIWEQHLGSEHPHVARALSNLAELYTTQGKYAEAEPLYQRALRIWEQQPEPEHPDGANALDGLANLYREQGRYAEAEPLYQRALHTREQAQGPQHPETALIMYNLAQLREAQDNLEEARAWYARVLTIREQALGTRHPKTIETRARLIALLHAMGQHEEAAQFEAAQSEQRTHGEEQKAHPEK